MGSTINNIDKSRLRELILELIKTDEDFRLTIAGAIGYQDILNELKKLREDFNKLYMKSLEHDKRFEEINKHLEVLEKKLLGHDERFKAIERKLLEHDKRFEIIEKTLNEHTKALMELTRRVNGIELELGALSESFYCKALWGDLREDIRARGESILYKRCNMCINDTDIDLFIETDKTVYVIEVKVKPKHEDIGALLAKTDLVRKRYPDKKVIPVLAGALVGREIEDYVREKKVVVYVY